MSSEVVGALAATPACVCLAPYLARLTLSVPDREDLRWWRGGTPSGARLATTAGIALVLGGLAGAAAGWSALLPAFLALAVAGVPLTIIDFEHHRLPDRLVRPAAVSAAALLGLAAALHHDWHPYLRAVEGAAAVFTVLLLIALVAPRSFGFGDVKLGGVLGAYLGWAGWSYVYFGIVAGFVLGTVVAVALLVARRASLKTALAFGPMLILGALIVLALDIAPPIGR